MDQVHQTGSWARSIKQVHGPGPSNKLVDQVHRTGSWTRSIKQIDGPGPSNRLMGQVHQTGSWTRSIKQVGGPGPSNRFMDQVHRTGSWTRSVEQVNINCNFVCNTGMWILLPYRHILHSYRSYNNKPYLFPIKHKMCILPIEAFILRRPIRPEMQLN